MSADEGRNMKEIDRDKAFGIRKNIRKPLCESRAILELLGFVGIQDFSRRSGVSHVTIGEIMGTAKMKHHKHHYNIIVVNEALHTAYMEVRDRLTGPARAYVCDWAERWKKDALENRLMVESAGRIGKDVSPTVLYDRKRKRKAVMDSLVKALKALEWKP
jgi:hypothetical protein